MRRSTRCSPDCSASTWDATTWRQGAGSARPSSSRPTKRPSPGCGPTPTRCRRGPRSRSRGCGSRAASEPHPFGILRAMPELIAGELVAAAVVDTRVWESQGDVSPDGIYLTGQPGLALPFVLFRAWKVPVGIVQEEVRLFGPSGRLVFRWGPEYRRMAGMFDLTTEVD